MNRQQIFAYVQKKYGTEPEYLWVRYPSYAVLRHGDNQKWYGMVMEVPQNKLGLPGTERVEILNVRGILRRMLCFGCPPASFRGTT